MPFFRADGGRKTDKSQGRLVFVDYIHMVFSLFCTQYVPTYAIRSYIIMETPAQIGRFHMALCYNFRFCQT